VKLLGEKEKNGLILAKCGTNKKNTTMKKQILILGLTAFAGMSATAQINRGAIQFGANVGITATNDNQTSTLQTAPLYTSLANNSVIGFSAGYFVANNFVVGLSAGFSESKGNTTTGTLPDETVASSTNSSVSFGPYARYYFRLGEKASIFTQISLGYAYNYGSSENSQTSSYGTPYDNKSAYVGHSISVGFVPGFSYSLSQRFVLEAQIGTFNYTSTSNLYTPVQSGIAGAPTTDNTGRLNLNFSTSSVLFGFKYYLRKA
jgi:hypothetical protein